MITTIIVSILLILFLPFVFGALALKREHQEQMGDVYEKSALPALDGYVFPYKHLDVLGIDSVLPYIPSEIKSEEKNYWYDLRIMYTFHQHLLRDLPYKERTPKDVWESAYRAMQCVLASKDPQAHDNIVGAAERFLIKQNVKLPPQ